MDVQLITSSVLELPSSERVDAIVYDGTTDLRPWPGPGPDRELVEAYGPEMPEVLERERVRLEGETLPIGQMLRLHRGKLHCDFLLWVATRGPEQKGIQAPAPSSTILVQAVKDALAFVAERNVHRVAFGPIGGGPGALEEVDRLVLVARAANAYYDECFAAGRPAGVEEVLVCHPFTSKIAEARRQLGRTVKMVQPAQSAAAAAEKPLPRKRVASGAPKKTTRKKAAPTLSEADVARGRATGAAYDRARSYRTGEMMIHPKFGVGRIDELTPEGFIVVLFETGESKRLLHGRTE